MSKQDELKLIAEDIVKNDVTSELRDGATRLVFAEGSEDAGIVFIGEAPGKKEDEIGLPFVGAAGKLLNQMLETIGLKREDVYITNIVKYRPPENRDPTTEEKEAFWPYLMRQLDVIKPKLVVTLGRHSMEYFLPKQKISAIHGEPKRVQLGEMEQWVLPLYHPAAALYNGGMRETLFEDFSKIPAILKNIINN
jgi:uracil-DNA glycosylase family 4